MARSGGSGKSSFCDILALGKRLKTAENQYLQSLPPRRACTLSEAPHYFSIKDGASRASYKCTDSFDKSTNHISESTGLGSELEVGVFHQMPGGGEELEVS
jgi:hypothetical protein